MTHDVIVTLAALGVAGQVLAALLLLVGLAWLAGVRGPGETLRRTLEGYELWLVFLVSSIATGGSLFFSEIAGFIPCELCWYQRICMYPLVPLLGIAAWRHDHAIRPYAAVLASIGALIAGYHVLVERFPTLESSVCDPTNPCTIIWVRHFGYLTIPAMALSGFVLILTLLAIARPRAGDRPIGPVAPTAAADPRT